MYLFLCVALLFAVCNAEEESVVEQPVVEDPVVEEPVVEEVIYECNVRNGYAKVEGSCDAYFECTDYQAFQMLCPDGLNFNPKAKWPMYPCSYPSDVPCVGGDTSQLPKSTANCPRQYGFFPSPFASANRCGQYRLCAEGHAYDMSCPFGLAFDTVRARCDWPDVVPGCNTEEYIGFICPAPDYDVKGTPLIRNFKHERDCYMFYSCQSGHARLLSCDPGFAFDANLERCVEAEYVNCTRPSEDKDATS